MTRAARAVIRPRARARTATPLSRELICRAALEQIDEHGLEELSVRKLGQALGCEGMALYWYYPSKDALLDAVVDALMADVARAIDRTPDDWVAVLRRVAHAYRRIAREHPKAFPLLATRRFASDGTYAFMEALFALARARGIPDRTTARFYRVVSSYCNGFALNELAAPRGPQDPSTAALRRRFARVAAVSAWLEPRYLDEIFDFGLELQLAALARTTREGRAR
jgi:AcrR family transcriptional regulator